MVMLLVTKIVFLIVDFPYRYSTSEHWAPFQSAESRQCWECSRQTTRQNPFPEQEARTESIMHYSAFKDVLDRRRGQYILFTMSPTESRNSVTKERDRLTLIRD